MKNYILVSDKWDTYAISNDRGVDYAALDLLRKRVEDGFWYDNWDDRAWENEAKDIVDREDADSALRFLRERSDFEYERIEVR